MVVTTGQAFGSSGTNTGSSEHVLCFEPSAYLAVEVSRAVRYVSLTVKAMTALISASAQDPHDSCTNLSLAKNGPHPFTLAVPCAAFFSGKQ